MKKYDVVVECWISKRLRKAGEVVELSEQQAKYYVYQGVIKPQSAKAKTQSRKPAEKAE